MELYEKKILKEIEQIKQEWKKVFYVEWVFDLFHEWHAAFLQYLRNKINSIYGDKFVLLVAVESDRKTKRKKWKSRPIDSEHIRYEKVKNTWLADLVYINDNDVRYLIDDLNMLKVDYLVFPEEYIKNLKLFLLIKSKFKKHNIRLFLARHKQYKKYKINKELASIHTTSILKLNLFEKSKSKFKHIIYLTKECLYILLKK